MSDDSIHTKISSGLYLCNVAYPKRPKRPILSTRSPSLAEAEKYRESLSVYEIEEKQFIEKRSAYYVARTKAEARFKKDLLESLGIDSSHPKAELLFSIAWELGHSNGLEDVVHYATMLEPLIG